MRNPDELRVFDLHCDTLARGLEKNEGLRQNSGQLDLIRGIRKRGRWVQCFACFLGKEDQGEAAFQKFLAMRAKLTEAVERHPEEISLWQPGNPPKEGVCTAILTVEGGQALAGRLENVERFARLGVKMLTLVWNGDNELGSSAVDGMDRGLTPFGRECLAGMERTGILPDISHLNDKGIEDVFSLASRPVVATHSNLRSVENHPRNLTEAQFSHLAAINGLCGVNFYPRFVNGGTDYSPDALRRHLDRMLSLGGERILALGSDFDGAAMPSFINDAAGLYTLYQSVVEWYGEKTADRIFYQNAADFMAANGGPGPL